MGDESIIIVQLILSVLLITLILLQQEGGASLAFRGFGAAYHTKRGAEKFIFILTVVCAVAFVALSLLNLTLLKGSVK